MDLSFLSVEAYIRIEPQNQERNDQVQLGVRALGHKLSWSKQRLLFLSSYNFLHDFELVRFLLMLGTTPQ